MNRSTPPLSTLARTALVFSLAWASHPLSAGPSEAESFFVDTSLDLSGELLSWHFVDLVGDARLELAVAVLLDTGEREVSVYAQGPDGLEREPLHTLPVLDDVLAWTAADVRTEPGRELVWLTKNGAWSYSLTLEGYRGNVQRLVEAELIYDVADARSLPYYPYVLPREAGLDSILLPERDSYAVWGPSQEAHDGTAFERAAVFAASAWSDVDDESEREKRRRGRGPGGSVSIQFNSLRAGPFVARNLERSSTLLANARRYRAPALVDLDGDGDLDLVRKTEEALLVHIADEGQLSDEPSQAEALVGDLAEDGATLRLVDLDGDRDLDLLVHWSEDSEGFENQVHRLLFYLNDGGRLLGEKPSQSMRFEAGALIVQVADVDADGRPDLVLRKLELPSLLGTMTGLEFRFSYLLFLGEKRGFARKPALKSEKVFDEESITEVIANRALRLDCDGDGIADLVEVDVNGYIAVRRLKRESSFFGGTSWSLEAAPWKRFDAGGSIESLAVEDLDGDGLADIVSASDRRLTMLFSKARNGASGKSR